MVRCTDAPYSAFFATTPKPAPLPGLRTYVIFCLMSLKAAACLTLVYLLAHPAFGKTKYQQPGRPIHLDHDGQKWAEKTLRKLSVDEKIGQLFMVWARAEFLNVDSPEYLKLRDTMLKYHVGSFAMTVRYEPPFLYKNEPYEAAVLLNRLQQDSKLPLLVAADFERGITMRLQGGTVFPHAMAFGATGNSGYAESFGRITAQEARAIGVQWNFFPVADVNSNPANPIINTRSFGEDPKQVGDMVAAYIRGAHENGMLTTAKHFPGHGDTATDSHLGVAMVTGNMQRLQTTELVPFGRAIEAGVDAMMVAHVTVPALDPDPSHVATTSPAIVTGLLKERLGFKGIVITDALDMAGLTDLYSRDIGRAAVDAFKAGNDMLLIPADLAASVESMRKAVQSGEISPARLDESVMKILQAKASLGLHKARLVDPENISEIVGKPQNLAVGQQVADDAVTLVRDNGAILPLKKTGTMKASLPYHKPAEPVSESAGETPIPLSLVIFSDDIRTAAGRKLEREIRSRVPGLEVMYVDDRTAAAMLEVVIKAVDQSQTVVAAIYMVPTAGKVIETNNGGIANSVALPESSSLLLRSILDHGAQKTVVVAAGNPYVAEDFPAIQNYLCTFSDESVSDTAAARALFGEIEIRGHLPVTIPNVAPRGAGIERPIQAANQGDHNELTK